MATVRQPHTTQYICLRCGLHQSFDELAYWMDDLYHCASCYRVIDVVEGSADPLLLRLDPSQQSSSSNGTILLVVDGLYVAGAQRHALDLCAQLAANGWSVTIAATEGGGAWAPRFTKLATVLIPRVPGQIDWQHVLHASNGEIRKASAHLKGPIDWAITRIPADLPLVAHLHSEPSEHEDVDYGWLARVEARVATFGVPSEATRQTYLRLADKLDPTVQDRLRRKFRVVPNTANISDAKGERGTSHGAIRRKEGIVNIGVLSRLDTDKLDICFLVSVMRLLAGCDVRFLIAGWGEAGDRLQSLIRLHGLQSCVDWLGCVLDVEAFLRRVDIIFLPSKREGLPYVALEAFEHQIPFVGPAVGALGEITDTPACTLYGVLDDAGASQALREMVDRVRKGQASDTFEQSAQRLRVIGADIGSWRETIREIYGIL